METPKQPQIRRIYCFKLNRCPLTQPPPLWLDLGQTGAFLRTKIPCKILWSSEPGSFFSRAKYHQALLVCLDQFFIRQEEEEDEEEKGGGDFGPVGRGQSRTVLGVHPCSSSLPSPARFLPVCSMSLDYSGHGAIICNSLFVGRERRVESEGENQ